MKFDLHTHSYYSDGTLSPSEVVRLAVKAGVRLLSLTDHDTVSGLEEASGQAKRMGLGFVPGIEINTAEPDPIHILGYGIDPGSGALRARLEEFRMHRRTRVVRMIQKLRALGIEIGQADLEAVSRESVGRPHLADILRRKGYVRTRQEAFRRYLMRGRPAYVEPTGPGIQEAIETIRKAGGAASLAHPGFLERGLDLPKWVQWGLGAIEAYYPTHSAAFTRRLAREAAPFSLLLTGGSDFHGPGTDRDKIGIIDPPQQAWDRVYHTLLQRKPN